MDALIALVDRCDRTYTDWAPPEWEPPDLTIYRERWEARAAVGEQWSLGAIDETGRIVGVVAWFPERSADGMVVPGIAHVNALFVDPSRWREGIASALLEMGLIAMRELDYGRAALWTPLGAPAEDFYRRLGWTPDGAQEWSPDLGLTVVRYTKQLFSEGR
jgi:GNAT superfamily N-acetyltransferase